MGKFIVFCLVAWFVVSFSKKSSKRKKEEPQRDVDHGEITFRVSVNGDWDDDDDDYNYKSTKTDAQCWTPPGKTVEVRNRSIPGGMVYVGDGLGSIQGYGAEPALINLKLKVAADTPCTEDLGMGYWPSYHSISAEARSAYLNWLSRGRRVQNAYIGYVFLFFYGLERQVLHAKCSGETLLAIRDEVKELLFTYGDNRSFRRYSENFLGLLNYMLGDGEYAPLTNPGRIARGMFPSSFKVALGKTVAAGKVIPWDMALEWILRDPETRLRVPAKRCPNEFTKLFRHHYESKFGEGMQVSPNKTMIRLEYYPASSSLRNYSSSLDIPDPTALSGPLKKLRPLVEKSMAELDAFSRLKGKDPDAANGIAGYALLPKAVAEGTEVQGLNQLKSICTGPLANAALCRAPANDLIETWPTKIPGKMNKSEAVQAAELLASFGVGMEPDPRYGGRTPSAGEEVVLFRLPGGEDEAPGTGYYQAQALVHLTGLVAAADGDVSPEERDALNAHLASSLGLNMTETTRLEAFFEWIIERPPSLAGMKAKLGGLSTAQRDKVADFLITVAGADGIIHPKEVKILERIYKTMGMEGSDVQVHIHRFLANGEAQPITVREADKRPSGHAIPSAPDANEGKEVKLDVARLNKKRAQTKEVAELLENVFAEEEQDVTPAVEEGAAGSGLDKQHVLLLEKLGAQEEWEREDFDALVQGMGLMPSGVLETLNDFALDNFDDEVLFDEEKIEVNRDVLEEVLAA